MRHFHITGPFGFEFSFSTRTPGTLSFQFGARAQSEPPAPTPSTVTLPQRSNSDYTMYIPMDVREDGDDQEDDPPAPPRAPSPAPTEILFDEPTPDELLATLKLNNIKIRDYAYDAPTPRQPEVFDPRRGIAEHEYRLAQDPREVPIDGKTLRRLLHVGWISQAEAEERWAEMDWEALRAFDASPRSKFEWIPMSVGSNTPPGLTERAPMVRAFVSNMIIMDRGRWRQEAQDRDAVLAEEVVERFEKRQRERLAMVMAQQEQNELDELAREFERETSPGGTIRKRTHDSLEESNPKRRRLSPEPSTLPKQYPAPLTSYDPEIYPEAASIIQSQGRTTPPLREDTPPLREDTPPPNALTRPKRGLRRTLSRTQTYSQL
ncbi:hypothetical protein BD779DRAFT_1474244 [Infundibulicybe gibba]|nr:hypothetical protein BD779DRAFT_1474244 [Infundibulicybe gibba]